MGVSGALRRLAGFLDEFEAEGGTVNHVGLVGTPDVDDDGTLSATVELTLPTGPDGTMSLTSGSVDSEGRLRVEFESVPAVVPTRDGVEVEPTDVTVGADGAVTVGLSASVPADVGATSAEASTATRRAVPADEPDTGTAESDGNDGSDGSDGNDGTGDGENGAAGGETSTRRGRDVPPFRDPELLGEVYESCDTFAEMTEALGMDVTSETVRRYMIDHGIHQPNSYDTGGGEAAPREAEAASEPGVDLEEDLARPVVVADGIGLPDDLTVENLIETVRRSNTIYEVKRDVGVGRADALELLRDLNLLDLVVGRLATEAERDISREEIIERLREASTAA